MFKRMSVALAATALPAAVLAHATAAPQIVAEAPGPSLSDPQAAAAWVARLAEAMAPQSEAIGRLNESQAQFAAIGTPAGLRAQGPKLKTMLGASRAGLQRSAALLAAMPAPGFTWSAPLKPERLVADAKAYNAATSGVVGDFEAYLGAAERGDRQTMSRLAPKLVESAFVLLDGKALLLRGRQAALPSAHSTYQLLAISAELSEAMAVSGRAWLQARVAASAETAAAALHERLAARVATVRAATAAGRQNLARERSDVERLVAGGPLSASEQRQIDVIKAILGGKEQMFAVGDSIAALLEANARISGAALTAQPAPKLVAELSVFEVQLERLSLAHAATASALTKP